MRRRVIWSCSRVSEEKGKREGGREGGKEGREEGRKEEREGGREGGKDEPLLHFVWHCLSSIPQTRSHHVVAAVALVVFFFSSLPWRRRLFHQFLGLKGGFARERKGGREGGRGGGWLEGREG